MAKTVIPLGTNGFFPSYNRQTMCFTLRQGQTLIILDAGSGLFRFAEPPGAKLLDGITQVHIYLSHYHLDHTFGFYAAFKYFIGKQVAVFAKTEKHVFHDITDTEYVGAVYPREYTTWRWQQLTEGEQGQDDYSVRIRKQSHNGVGSLAFRFQFPEGKSLAYVTDSEPTPASVSFCRGVDLLLHEHYLRGENIPEGTLTTLEKHYLGGHTTTRGAALVAKYAGVKQLALVHHHPFHDDTVLEQQLADAQLVFSRSTLAQDFEPLSL